MNQNMKQIKIKISLIALAFVIGWNGLYAQDSDNNAITTAAPFLNINPDSRAAGMGDAGVVLRI
jgi:hypothetical protein